MRERLDDFRVEMLARTFGDDRHSLFIGEGFLVHAFGHQRIEHVSHRHDTSRERNFFALDSRRITGAVPLFVVVVRHVNRFVQVVRIDRVAGIFHHLRKNFPTFGGMTLHDSEFFIRQLARLVQNQVRHGNLSDIVERGSTFQFLNKIIGQDIGKLAFLLELFGQSLHIGGSFLNVITGALVARFNDFSEFHNNHFLHLANSFRLPLHSSNKVIGIGGHGRKRIVQVTDFVKGGYLQVHHPICRIPDLFQVYLFGIHGACNHCRSRELHRGKRHTVHRNHNAAIHQFDDNTHDDNRKTEEQREHLDKEHRLVRRYLVHRDVSGRIGNSPPRRVPNRRINRQQPAKLVIRDNRFNFATGKQCRKVRNK